MLFGCHTRAWWGEGVLGNNDIAQLHLDALLLLDH
jgi:hypothetical protein